MTAPVSDGRCADADAQSVVRPLSSLFRDRPDGSGGVLADSGRVVDGPDDDGTLWIDGRAVRTRAFASTTVAPRIDGRDGEFGSDCVLSPQEWDEFTQRVLNAGMDPAGTKWLCPLVGNKESVYSHIVMTFSRLTDFQDGSFANDAGFVWLTRSTIIGG